MAREFALIQTRKSEISKHSINEKLEIPVDQQQLFYQDRLLEDDCTLSSYGIEAGSLIPMSNYCMITSKDRNWRQV